MNNKRTRKLAKAPLPPDPMDQKNDIELPLCHVAELIDLAQEIACNLHSGTCQSEIGLQISGRIGTLLHCAQRELEMARHKATRLNQPT